MIRHLSYLLFVGTASAVPFSIEKMPNPPGVDPQIGAVDVLPDGKVAAAFHRGEVMVFDPEAKSWSKFAEGLQEPLGMIAESDSSLLVMQRAELTRVEDVNGDGRADEYQTVFDGFGMTGNYHEFAFGPAKGPDGSLYIALNVASNGAGIRPEIRGEWSDIGVLNFEEMQHDGSWRDRAVKAGRMYSRVPWRGWVLKLSPDGSEMEPYACGFRSPDGIGFDAKGNLLVTDNEGDWRGTSPLYAVKKGGFHGHAPSLVWQEGWSKGDPRMLPEKELDGMRIPEAGRFPQGELANSPTQPIVFPESWGPFAGQVLIGEMNQARMVRYLSDEVSGFQQGTLIPMFDGTSLGIGNHRLAFGKDGALWVGKTHLSWAGAEGLVKIMPHELDKVFTTTSVKLVKAAAGSVLKISFSQPVVAGAEGVKIDRFSYLYRQEYGSPKIDEAAVEISQPVLSDDGRELTIGLTPTKGAIHRVNLKGLRAADDVALEGQTLYYQASELP